MVKLKKPKLSWTEEVPDDVQEQIRDIARDRRCGVSFPPIPSQRVFCCFLYPDPEMIRMLENEGKRGFQLFMWEDFQRFADNEKELVAIIFALCNSAKLYHEDSMLEAL